MEALTRGELVSVCDDGVVFCWCCRVGTSFCSQQDEKILFKSDRGALSVESRETLLTTRSSSERSL